MVEVDVAIETEPPGAVVALDGKPIGRSRLALRLKPGTYRIGTELEGFDDRHEEIVVPLGMSKVFELELASGLSGPERRHEKTNAYFRWPLTGVALASLTVWVFEARRARAIKGDLVDGTIPSGTVRPTETSAET